MTSEQTWLSISQAAQFLGVHFSTLRRWSDQGVIEFVRTPGGRRKYQRKTLDAFLERYRTMAKDPGAFLAIRDRAILNTRERLHSLSIQQKNWYVQLTEEQRAQMRSTGSQLVALMLQYSASPTHEEVYLEEARRITRGYGRMCCTNGVPISECVQTFLLFRQPIIKAFHETNALPGINQQHSGHLFDGLNYFLDESLIAMIDEYQHAKDGSFNPTTGAP